MKKRVFSVLNRVELKVYEVLQVRFFQKMVFLLEKVIHRRDGGVNQNYHIEEKQHNSTEMFIKYLFYNGMIHVRNLIFLSIYFTIKYLFFSIRIYDFIFLLLGIKDLYCIMLQRYNYLRIRRFQKIAEERREKVLQKKVKQISMKKYNFTNREEDLLFIKRLKEGYENNSYIIVDEKDINSLKRLTMLVQTQD